MSGLKIEHGAWVMVGDGEKALFLRNEGDATYPNLEVINVWRKDNPPTSAQGADRPGRSFASMGSRRSALEQTDWHRLEKHKFAVEIAQALHEAARQDAFRQLVIVAPPEIMGELRKSMHKDVADRIVAEVSRHLTHMPSHQIEKALLS